MRRFERYSTNFGIHFALLIAFAVQFFGLGARTFHGDELGSVLEAQQFGRNANSLPYSALLHLWLGLGTSEFWLRSLSALAAVAAVALAYAWVKRLCGGSTARLVVLLLATSPFLVVYGQQIRFYTLALFAAGVCVWGFVVLLTKANGRTYALWLFASLVAVGALFMNILLVLGQTVTLFAASQRLKPRAKIIVSCVVIGLILAFVSIPSIRESAFNLLASYTNAEARFTSSRGIALSQIAKIPLSLFFFAVGESVYPLNFAIVVPAILLFAAAAFLGVTKLRRNRKVFWFIMFTSVVAMGSLYLVFDSLAPSDLQGAAPRYLIFLLPLFYLVIAIGARGTKTRWLVPVLLLVNTGSLGSYWFGDWSYTDDLVDWRAVTHWAGGYVAPDTLVLADGRANDLANHYFPGGWKRQAIWAFESPDSLQALDRFPRIIFLSYDFHADRREFASSLMQRLDGGSDKIAAWSNYPLFIYVYDRKQNSPNTIAVDAASGTVDSPIEIYGLEFQDLTLPLRLSFKDHSIQSAGAFRLPAFDNQSSRRISFAQPQSASKILLFSNLTDADRLTPGTVIANLLVYSDIGTAQTLPLRIGYETSAWNRSCASGECSKAFTWRKRFALLGSERYPESWEEFDASIFGIELSLNQATQVRALEFQSVSPHNPMYIWGIALEP